MRNISLEGRWAVITGASRGIGAALMAAFTECGANVIVCARANSESFAALRLQLAEAHKVSVEPFFFDFEDSDAVKHAARAITSRGHTIDILVNNAGVASGSLFQMTSVTEMRRLFEVNFFGPLLFTQPIAKLMAKSRAGSIVNIASTAGLRGDPGTLSYGSSKAALALATKVLAAELGDAGIRVNAVAPSVTRTAMYDQMDPKAKDKLINAGILKRAAEPEEVVNAVLYLASDLSSFVTGQVIRVDGGQV